MKALRVRRPGIAQDYYYLEFRQPFGAFDTFAGTDPVVNGVSIRIASDYPVLNKSQLIDTTPSTAAFSDSALGVGQTFQDPASGLTVTTTSIPPGGAMAEVSVTLTCVHANPSVLLISAQPWVRPGVQTEYQFTLTNTDSVGCPPSTFSFAPVSLPGPGWTQEPNPLNVQLAPNASTSVSVRITSPTGTASGAYLISERLQNLDTPTLSGSTTLIYKVDGSPPSIPANLRQNGPITIAQGAMRPAIILAAQQFNEPDGGGGGGSRALVPLAWDASTDPHSYVAGYRLYWCYATTSGCTPAVAEDVGYVTSYTFSAAAPGSYYALEVAAVDNAGNISARSNRLTVFIEQ